MDGAGNQRTLLENRNFVVSQKIGAHNFIGHNSAYGGMVFYNLDTDTSLILNINQVIAPHKAEWLLKKTVEAYFS